MRIYKYPLKAVAQQIVQMPRGAKPLTVQLQDLTPCIWAEIDPDEPAIELEVWAVSTGMEFDFRGFRYLGTVQMLGLLVLHFYSRPIAKKVKEVAHVETIR